MIDAARWARLGDEPLPGKLRLLDQTKLPMETTYIELDDAALIHEAVKRLVVRGAPAIGIAAAYGLIAVVQHSQATNAADFEKEVRKAADYLATSRPTAVNLFWALDRCRGRLAREMASNPDVAALKAALWQEADAICREDIAMCRGIGEHGVELFTAQTGVLTHCNAGALATGDYGTALSPIYLAHERKLKPRVFADETRPLLQGARLTAWELQRAGVDVTVICDNMAAQVMREGKIDLVIVGADRIAANGDAANKIGTYGVAILANYHGIPFYVAAPYSTIDMATPTGAGIPIEQRDGAEIGHGFGRQTAPTGVTFYNPAFDVTPHDLIAGIITERGILRAPYDQSIRQLFASPTPTA